MLHTWFLQWNHVPKPQHVSILLSQFRWFASLQGNMFQSNMQICGLKLLVLTIAALDLD
jgi:hypothetical protein